MSRDPKAGQFKICAVISNFNSFKFYKIIKKKLIIDLNLNIVWPSVRCGLEYVISLDCAPPATCSGRQFPLDGVRVTSPTALLC